MVNVCLMIAGYQKITILLVKSSLHSSTMIENYKAGPGRAHCAQWVKEDTFYRKQALKFVKKA